MKTIECIVNKYTRIIYQNICENQMNYKSKIIYIKSRRGNKSEKKPILK